MARKVETRHEGFITAHDHHDQEVRDHHHVDKAEHHQHDLLLAKVVGVEHQMTQFLQEQIDVHALRDDQAEIERQLQPARSEDHHRERAEAW